MTRFMYHSAGYRRSSSFTLFKRKCDAAYSVQLVSWSLRGEQSGTHAWSQVKGFPSIHLPLGGDPLPSPCPTYFHASVISWSMPASSIGREGRHFLWGRSEVSHGHSRRQYIRAQSILKQLESRGCWKTISAISDQHTSTASKSEALVFVMSNRATVTDLA